MPSPPCTCPHPHAACPFIQLGFDAPVTREVAKKRYYDLCRTLHPDVPGVLPAQKERFLRVSEAWKSLKSHPRLLQPSISSCPFQYGPGYAPHSSAGDARYPPSKGPVRYWKNGTVIATVIVAVAITGMIHYCRAQYSPKNSTRRVIAEHEIRNNLWDAQARARHEGSRHAMERFRASADLDRPKSRSEPVDQE